METFIVFVDIFILVFGILSIVLFFKLWWMCDDVKEIAASMKQIKNSREEVRTIDAPQTESIEKRFSTGQLVIVKDTEAQFRIDDIMEGKDGGFLYYSSKFDKYFTEDEIEDFKAYWAGKK